MYLLEVSKSIYFLRRYSDRYILESIIVCPQNLLFKILSQLPPTSLSYKYIKLDITWNYITNPKCKNYEQAH